MWYKNIAGRFFGLVTKHACVRRTGRQTDRQTDRRTDRITTPKTALAERRAVKIMLSRIWDTEICGALSLIEQSEHSCL